MLRPPRWVTLLLAFTLTPQGLSAHTTPIPPPWPRPARTIPPPWHRPRPGLISTHDWPRSDLTLTQYEVEGPHVDLQGHDLASTTSLCLMFLWSGVPLLCPAPPAIQANRQFEPAWTNAVAAYGLHRHPHTIPRTPSPPHTPWEEGEVEKVEDQEEEGEGVVMRAPPKKRYLGIELPDYIAAKHTSLRAINSNYLARINRLKQRMRSVGK